MAVPERPASKKARPDPRPARLAMAAGAVAVASIAAAGLALPTASGSSAETDAIGSSKGRPRRVASAEARGAERPRRIVRYVHLKPGQKAPPGARVIRAAEPPPRVVVIGSRTAPSPVRRRPVVSRSRQSG